MREYKLGKATTRNMKGQKARESGQVPGGHGWQGGQVRRKNSIPWVLGDAGDRES
jgi:hypothetical protein